METSKFEMAKALAEKDCSRRVYSSAKYAEEDLTWLTEEYLRFIPNLKEQYERDILHIKCA